MHRVAAKYVLRLLSEYKQQNLVDIDRSNENFLMNIVTGDDTWIYGYDV
jgi:hypothetical protein